MHSPNRTSNHRRWWLNEKIGAMVVFSTIRSSNSEFWGPVLQNGSFWPFVALLKLKRFDWQNTISFEPAGADRIQSLRELCGTRKVTKIKVCVIWCRGSRHVEKSKTDYIISKPIDSPSRNFVSSRPATTSIQKCSEKREIRTFTMAAAAMLKVLGRL